MEDKKIAGIGRTPSSALIEKARPLLSLCKTNMSLASFKILDAYLARINSHNPDAETVIFEKGEIEDYLDVSKILISDLRARLEPLMTTVTLVEKEDEFDKIVLFSRARAVRDEVTGLWTVQMTCTSEAKKYIFNIENIGYLRYRLKNIVNLTSRYSYVMFLYLLDNRFRKSWVVSVEEIKNVLNCTAETYSVYKRFNNLILRKCQKEILEKTDVKFEYTPIKKGRKITSIQFTIITISEQIKEIDNEQITGMQLSLPLYEDLHETDVNEIEYGGELADLLGDSACNNEFSPTQIRSIQDLVIQRLPNKDNLERCDYLSKKYHLMNVYDEKNTIIDRYKYLCTMIENEIEEKSHS